MKRAMKLVPVVTLMVGVAALGGIVGSKHDLTSGGSADGANQIGGLTQVCLPCHTPHFADTSASEAPLWNHELTVQTFQMYVTLNNTPTNNANGASKLCLSCHDGVTAMDNYGGATGGALQMSDPAGSTPVVGTDLRNDHPIGLTYPSSGAYNPAATVKLTLRLPNDGTADRVECQSCHDPHLTTNGFFLRVDNANSALCTTCHTL